MARLNQLRFIVAELEKQNFAFESLPATSSIRTYREWSTDPEKRELDEASVTNSGKKVAVGLEAFGLPDTGGADKTQYKVGERARTKANALGLTKFGLTLTLTDDHINRNGFTPARCIVALQQAPGTRQRSNITSRYYRPRTNGSFTIPFGKLTGALTEFEAQEQLATDSAITTTHSVTFTPERIRRR